MASKLGVEALQTAKVLFQRMTFGSDNFNRVASKCQLVSAEPGKIIAEMKIEEEHLNPGDMLHGGLTATLVDLVSTFAFVISDRGHPGVSVNINVTYMRPGRINDTILIDANVLKTGKTMGFAIVDIRNKVDNKIIAQGTHTKAFPRPDM